ncbi:MAG: hypothetical protein IKW87_12695 [Ruminococcus sp.]|nr:hypothetical protein [Ruminococcus sp.]
MRTVRAVAAAAAVYLLSAFFCLFGGADASAYENVLAEIPVSCSADSVAEQVYTINLEAVTKGAPMPERASVELTKDEQECFGIPLTEPGTFSYRIYQIKGSNEYIDYDTKVYGVTLFVENDGEDGLLYSLVADADGNGSKSESIEFCNYVLGERDRRTDTTAVSSTVTTTTTTTTAAATTAVTTTEKKSSENTVQEYIGTVLTGDTFPAHTVRIIMLAAIAAAVLAFLFKRRSSEEEENQNE